MAQMIRKQIYLEACQESSLKNRAHDLKLSEAELIRRGVDLVLKQELASISDAQSWKQELEFIAERAGIPSIDSKRIWTREDLYEERLSG